MRPSVLRLLPVLLLAAAALPATAQRRDGALPRQSPSALVGQTFGVTTVTVTYGRPAARGRTLYGTGEGVIAPDGQVWRTGADEASTITFSTAVRVEGRSLAAGTYGLFTIPGPARWTVIFNRVAEQWGAFQYAEAQDALRVTVTPTTGAPADERFGITFDAVSDTSATMTLAWGTRRVPVRLAAATDALVRTQGDAAGTAATDWRVPFRYAQFALGTERMPDAGRAWADRAAALEANYATLRLVALYAAARNDLAAARTAGERALALGRAQATPPQGLAEFERRLATWRAGR